MEIFRSIAELEKALGRELGPTDWFPVEQPRVDGFADVTEDHQWIHVDPERGAAGPFGATVAHGFLTVSLIPYFAARLRRIEGARMGVNYGLNRVRFPAPVRVGSRVRARCTMTELERVDATTVQLVLHTVIEVDGERKPACVADLVSRYYFPADAG
ncbi:MaoC family dehydratase [Cryptosporangium aurantiacum]|uniref:Acyl dehydratase n=1 Tax=Cryptosporangium aurantiacum TaxID=134849 RepID=A0A1M7PNE6_9ACTN|nr:MaoC family dehydratase [Cryptosporangium aurantiacum]SHN18873.1 Acyl dehydratase [Cryptosporangium aurantiacum]